jgi:hypothetical protein
MYVSFGKILYFAKTFIQKKSWNSNYEYMRSIYTLINIFFEHAEGLSTIKM